jgi:PII interaction protein X
MSNEVYLNHPTFGLLYRVCLLDETQEIFTTLYAQRLFFLVKTKPEGVSFEPTTRANARMQIENRLRQLRRTGSNQEYQTLYQVYQQTF